MRLLSDVQMGTLSGTLCSLLFYFPLEDVLRTVITAAVGATVSFAVSWLLKKWGKKR